MSPFFLNVILHALASAPSLIADLETLMSQNWSHPTVQTAVTGVQAIADMVDRVEAAQAAPAATDDPTGTVTANGNGKGNNAS